MRTQLIMIEGMIGAGKSTTAKGVADWLISRGEDARAFHEFAEDHPIRTKAVDLLRATYPEPVWSPDDVGEDGLARDPGVYAVDQWGRLAERCRQGSSTVILESSFLQNSILPAFVNGAPADRLTDMAATIQQQLAPAQPLLIYLRPTDIASAIERVHDARGEPWASWNAASVAGYPWAQRRDLHGRQAVIELYHAWESVVRELYDLYPYPKLMIDDPHDDWDSALQRIHDKARP